MEQLNIYDNYSIDLNKYPRKEIKYRITDIVLITLIMNIEQLKRICKCYNEAYNSYNKCKEYYFFLEFKLDDITLKKNYSAKSIISLMKEINYNLNLNQNNIKKYLDHCDQLDVILYFYLKNKEFFEKLFEDLENAKIFYFQGRNFSIKFDVPYDFYNHRQSNIYSALELFEIYTYSQYLVKNKIIKNLPLPKYLD